jgi:hypothetical protein
MSSLTVRRLFGAAGVLCLVASAVVVGSVVVPARTLALPGASESTVVTVEPTRVLDTRYDIGLTGQVAAGVARKVTITGIVDTYLDASSTTVVKQVVPAGATGVLLNVTAVSPTAAGFLSIRPGTAAGVPATAGLNFVAGDIVPNAVTVALPTAGANAGQIDLYYGTPTPDATLHVVADIVGYTTSTGLADLVNRVKTLETSGVQGDQGPAGPAGVDAESPARVIWVADDGTGDYLQLSDALTAIGTTLDAATVSNPYLIKIAPGVYTETAPAALKSFVDVEGSGQDITTITCACGNIAADTTSATVSAGNIAAEIRHLTINNTGTGSHSFGVYTTNVSNGSFSMLHITATATDASRTSGVYNDSSSPTMNNVTATATGTGGSFSAGVHNDSSSPTMNNVTATATDAVSNSGVYNNLSSAPTMNNVTAIATGGSFTHGVYNYQSSAPTMNNVTATATGPTFAYGVFNQDSSSATMNNVTANATGGAGGEGVTNLSSSSSIRNSSITGSTTSISSGGSSSAQVADTVLDGSVAGGGAGFTCTGVYTSAFVALNDTCT